MKSLFPRRKRAFSLVELVVVIVIIGIIAAMAIPRLSRGSAGAGQSALAGNLAILRNAFNMYNAEHNGVYPSGTSAQVIQKLTMYTDINGATNASRTGAFIYGPYLVSMPTCPVVSGAASNTILIDGTPADPPAVDTTNGEGWVYNSTSGQIIANSSGTDSDGRAYSSY